MKLSALAAGIAVCLAGFGGAVYAQQDSNSSNGNGNVSWVGSQTPSPESPAAARDEARSMLRQSTQECKREHGMQAQKDCMKSAHEDYSGMMGSTHGSGHMSKQ